MPSIESFRQYRKEAGQVLIRGAIATTIAFFGARTVERVSNMQSLPNGTEMDPIYCSLDDKPMDSLSIEGNLYELESWNCGDRAYVELVANKPHPNLYIDALGGFYADKNDSNLFRYTRSDFTGVHFDLEEGKFTNIQVDPPKQR